jgi:hypothetical protein
MNEHSRVEREVSVFRHSQAVNVCDLIQRFYGNHFMVVAMLPAAMIMNAEATN